MRTLFLIAVFLSAPVLASDTIDLACTGQGTPAWTLKAFQTTHGPSIVDDVEYELVLNGKTIKGTSKGSLGLGNGHFEVEDGRFRYVDANRAKGIVRLTFNDKVYREGVCQASTRLHAVSLECDFVENGKWVENKLFVSQKSAGFEVAFKKRIYKAAGVIGNDESRLFLSGVEGGLFVNYLGRPGPGKDTGPWMRDRRFRHAGRFQLERLDTEVRCRREWN